MTETEQAKTPNRRKLAARRTILTGLAFIAGFIVLAIVGTQVWEWSNSTAFCANVCHDVHPEEPTAYADSYHARVKCVECHMSRVGTLYNLYLKAGHMKHLFSVALGQYEHPTEAETMRPVDESCELCHWPPAFHGDTVREIAHYESDEQNSETVTYLILKTGGGEGERGLGSGIHWHIENQVEFIATREDNQEIPWVRATFPDDTVVEYNDAISPLSSQEIEGGEIQVMECIDCHNRVGHPFPSPDLLLDQAMSAGRINTELPFVKQELLDLLSADYANQEEGLEAIETLRDEYEEANPAIAAQYAEEINQATEVARDLITRLVFEEEGVTWQSFPNEGGHGGHTASVGCFRCHDGKHLSEEGESIRLHCNICHSIPVVAGPEDMVPELPVSTGLEPPSHLESNFIADHRFQANSACEPCHGEMQFGTDDSSFCANSACHGRAWPSVELNAAFPHPIELENRHAEVWCHDCHEGIERPAFECSNCHEPPMESHFGDACEDCHTTEGFESAFVTGFEHPVELEGIHAELECLACHTAGETLTYECSECHEPPSATHFGDSCEDCHTPDGFAGATLPPGMHPVPLVGAHLRATCAVCHADGERVPEYICSNCHMPQENHLPGECDDCHTPEGWVESVAPIVSVSPEIPHTLEGREDCVQCHAPDSQIRPARASTHTGRINEQCGLCHKPE